MKLSKSVYSAIKNYNHESQLLQKHSFILFYYRKTILQNGLLSYHFLGYFAFQRHMLLKKQNVLKQSRVSAVIWSALNACTRFYNVNWYAKVQIMHSFNVFSFDIEEKSDNFFLKSVLFFIYKKYLHFGINLKFSYKKCYFNIIPLCFFRM